jgi:hypothetical protein
MKIYLATWMFEESQGKSLSKTNKWNRLLSYFHTREKVNYFETYIIKGTNT